MVPLVIVLIAVAVGVSAFVVTKNPDSPVEQAAEAVIESQTGVNVDFSPDSE